MASTDPPAGDIKASEAGAAPAPPRSHSSSSIHAKGSGSMETPPHASSDDDAARAQASHRVANPLFGLTADELTQRGEAFSRESGFEDEDDLRAFRLGAQLAADPNKFDTIEGLTQEERDACRMEVEHPWRSNPKMLYIVIVICSLCAAVQGMDETVVNGAQTFYKVQFGIGGRSQKDAWLVGLTNGAPYLCCALIGCWLTDPLNRRFGRRGTIFISCAISFLACFWQAFTNTWWHMFIARFVLGFGIGPKSATTPIFAAECAPPKLRGALVMQWQMWTAFGIMVGYIADLAFYFVPDHGIELGLNWRLMMGSAGIPAIIVCAMVYRCPESPRWYLDRGEPRRAYESMRHLRKERVQAARDVFYAHTLLQAERVAMSIGKKNRLLELFTVRRNRNAAVASEIVMFMQQFCGVNVIAYYSSEIFLDANFSNVAALAASLGWGTINFLMAIPAIYTIDTFGRRNLLLTTFPLMALCLFFTGFSFWIPTSEDNPNPARIACITLGLYLFGIVYSPGEGPVPFTYSAEAYPLYIRPIGMSLATATTWLFNFVLSVTWPSLLLAFKPQGAFSWYAGWNIVGFFLVLFFVPETKERTLEELDQVFGVPLRKIIAYGAAQSRWFVQHYIFRRAVPPPPLPHAPEFEHSAREFTQEKTHRPEQRA